MDYGFKLPYLDVRTHDGRNFTAIADADYQAKDGTFYRIQSGATSDGASTPPVLWAKFDLEWLPPFGSYWMAAFLHDAAYRNSLLTWNGTAFVAVSLPKDKCDDLLREAMQSLGTHNLAVEEIYHGVVECGESSFEKDRATAA